MCVHVYASMPIYGCVCGSMCLCAQGVCMSSISYLRTLIAPLSACLYAEDELPAVEENPEEEAEANVSP